MDFTETAISIYNETIIAFDIATISSVGKRCYKNIKKDTGLTSAWLSSIAKGGVEEAGFKKFLTLRLWLIDNKYI